MKIHAAVIRGNRCLSHTRHSGASNHLLNGRGFFWCIFRDDRQTAACAKF
jgi:hypothetical protein